MADQEQAIEQPQGDEAQDASTGLWATLSGGTDEGSEAAEPLSPEDSADNGPEEPAAGDPADITAGSDSPSGDAAGEAGGAASPAAKGTINAGRRTWEVGTDPGQLDPGIAGEIRAGRALQSRVDQLTAQVERMQQMARPDWTPEMEPPSKPPTQPAQPPTPQSPPVLPQGKLSEYGRQLADMGIGEEGEFETALGEFARAQVEQALGQYKPALEQFQASRRDQGDLEQVETLLQSPAFEGIEADSRSILAEIREEQEALIGAGASREDVSGVNTAVAAMMVLTRHKDQQYRALMERYNELSGDEGIVPGTPKPIRPVAPRTHRSGGGGSRTTTSSGAGSGPGSARIADVNDLALDALR